MSARTILNPPLNTTLQELVNENPTFQTVTATVFEGATTIATTQTGVVQCGSAIANSYIQTPTLYVNTIAPVAPSVITTLTSGSMAVSIFGSNSTGVIASNSQASPFPVGGTQLALQTFTNPSTAVTGITLTPTNCYVAVPIVPQYSYPVSNTSSIGYTHTAYVASLPVGANVYVAIATLTIPISGLWLITGQCSMSTGGNILTINTVGTLIQNLYCSVASSASTTQCSNVFNLTSGAVINLLGYAGGGGNTTGIYLTIARIA